MNRSQHLAGGLARHGLPLREAVGLGLWDEAGQAPVDEQAGELLTAVARAADPDLALRQLFRMVETERRTAARRAAADAAGAAGGGASGAVGAGGAGGGAAAGGGAVRGAGAAGAAGAAAGAGGASGGAAAGADGAAGAEPGQLLGALATDPGLRRRLVAVLGASSALGDYLVANLDQWSALATAKDGVAPAGDGALESDGAAGLTGAPAVAALRRAYRRALLRVAAADLTGGRGLEQVMAALSTLADATLAAAYEIALAELPATAHRPRLAVIAMGKCGGDELNYVSDVDVIFVAGGDEDLSTATTVATRLIDICGQVAWPVDAALRPEGNRGPLVRTLASHLAYYRRWARTWEFQALLKARPATGDRELAEHWLAALHPLVWQAAERPEAVEDIRAMRRRIIDNVPRQELDREIKRGPGGLRDIEFAVQLLQLVHGRGDEKLRQPGTVPALSALVTGGYVGRQDGETLVRGYRFLRTVEHRLQLQRLRRTHTVPADPVALRWLAQAMGYTPDARRDAAQAFRADWIAHAAEVRRLHAKLLYRPLLEAVAKVPAESLRLSPDQARRRLELLGFADPPGALRHLQALTGGVSRTAAIQRTLLPVLLEEFADAPQPDRGLLAYRQVSESLGSTPWYLRLLRDEGPVAQRLARQLARSRYVAELLARDPEALRLLADDAELTPRSAEVLRDGFTAAAARHLDGAAPGPGTAPAEARSTGAGPAGAAPARERPAPTLLPTSDPEEVVRAGAAIRALRCRELFRVACADVLSAEAEELAARQRSRPAGSAAGPVPTLSGLAGSPRLAPAQPMDVIAVGNALSDVTDATLGAALHAARCAVGTRPDLRFAIIGMGRLGGYEMSYASDADVLFVYDPPPSMAEDTASGAASAIAEQLRRLLTMPAHDPPLGIDADLRPEGRQGPLVRSLAAFVQYYARWSKVWEAQALLRARFVCGDEDLGRRFLTLADQIRYPAGGLRREQIVEIRRIKARVESERLPRNADPATHTKLGRGGLTDVEWAAQLLQLRHAHSISGLRTPRTVEALAVARDAGLVSPADTQALIDGWMLASRVRNALTLVRGRAADQLPRHGVELAGVARLFGRADHGEFLDEYLRTARRARSAMERVFHG